MSARLWRQFPGFVLALVTLVGTLSWTSAHADTFDEWIRSFADSEIQFKRSGSNVPFVPLAYAEATYYNDIDLDIGDERVASFDQQTVSQGAALPILLGQRDMLMVGEWLSWSRFDTRSESFDSFDVLSVGIPVGWLRQVNPAWQAAAFVMPLAHKASLADSSWSWETMGGAFARYEQRDDLWWAFGVFADVGPGDDTFLPYIGASWEIDDKWTLSAIMPWPALLYAPSRNTLLRIGASPSGASWSFRPGSSEVYSELGSWNLGLAAEHRVQGNFWLKVEAGAAGLRTLRFSGGDWEAPEYDIGSSAYVRIGINYRPELP